jgi:hypothetical protein
VGAGLWHGLRDRSDPTRPPFAYTDVVHSKTTRYFRSRNAALRGIEEAREWGGDVTVVGPSPIGPWRAQWWRRFSEGYRIDIEERRQWQGRCGGGEHCYMPPPCQGCDPQRLQHILDCHNVTAAEWSVLAFMDYGGNTHVSHLPRRVAETADKHFGLATSEDECRTGLDACLRYGWLRLAQHAGDEIDLLLQAEPAMMPMLTNVRGWDDEVDFTPCGATLYRTIAAEWRGPDWEDDLRVWKETYREEHRYCEAPEGLRGIERESAARGEIVRASKLVPLGPWCVYWWERFPAGYRLELQIGKP